MSFAYLLGGLAREVLALAPRDGGFCSSTISFRQAQSPAALANWGQWRGPLGTGVSPQGNPPTEWSETKNVQWKVKIPGDGTSTPVIWGDKIFVLTAGPAKELGVAGTPLGARRGSVHRVSAAEKKAKAASLGAPPPTEPYQFVLMCLDRNSGKTLWQKAVSELMPHEGKHPADGSFAAALGDDRRRARDRLLRLARAGLLRPGRQPEVEERPRAARDPQRLRRRSDARSLTATTSSCRGTTKARTSSSPSTSGPATNSGGRRGTSPPAGPRR